MRPSLRNMPSWKSFASHRSRRDEVDVCMNVESDAEDDEA